MGYNGKEVKEVMGQLRSDRKLWDSHWQEVSDFVIPNKNNFTRLQTEGEKKGIEIFDSCAIHSNQLLAGALHGMLTNPSSLWFGYSTGNQEIDRNDAVRKWLDKTSMTSHVVLNNSNFQTEIHEVYLDLGSIGTSVLYIEPDKEYKVRFSAQHLANCFIMENNKGMVDTVFRCFKFTLKQAVQEWPKSLPAEIRKEAEETPSKKMEFIHAVYPRDLYSNASKGPKRMRFASCYFMEHKGEYIELSESGYRTFPYACPRWSKTSGEIYGRSPGMNCLADTKMVNAMMETTIKGGQKVVDPPLMAPDDGFVRKIKLTPGGVNYYRAGTTDRIEPLMTNSRIDYGYQMVEDVRTRIRSAFFVDQLQLNQGPQMTATEVMQRTEEKLRLMGPVLGRQHAELLKPMIERVFDILQEANVFDPAPEILEKTPKIDVQYTSAIAKVQMQSEIINIQKAMSAVAPIAQANPESLDMVDTDKTVRFILEKSGVPQELIRDQKEIKAIRAGRAEAQKQQAEQQAGLSQSEMAANMAPAVKAMSESVAPTVA